VTVTSVADLRARLRVLLAGRKPLRAVSIGSHGGDLLDLSVGSDDGPEPGS
jgi:hypothetical protein